MLPKRMDNFSLASCLQRLNFVFILWLSANKTPKRIKMIISKFRSSPSAERQAVCPLFLSLVIHFFCKVYLSLTFNNIYQLKTVPLLHLLFHYKQLPSLSPSPHPTHEPPKNHCHRSRINKQSTMVAMSWLEFREKLLLGQERITIRRKQYCCGPLWS